LWVYCKLWLLGFANLVDATCCRCCYMP
jgi:hypothetical protein